MSVEDPTTPPIHHQTTFEVLKTQKSDNTAQHNTAYRVDEIFFPIHSFNHQIRSDKRQSDFHTSHIQQQPIFMWFTRSAVLPPTESHIPRRINTKPLCHNIESIEPPTRALYVAWQSTYYFRQWTKQTCLLRHIPALIIYFLFYTL
eukprot:374362_1